MEIPIEQALACVTTDKSKHVIKTQVMKIWACCPLAIVHSISCGLREATEMILELKRTSMGTQLRKALALGIASVIGDKKGTSLSTMETGKL